MITADIVAHAVVTACRETGEDPIVIIGRGYTKGEVTKARHYALHALVHAYPKAEIFNLCLCVGCSGSPQGFWHNTKQLVIRVKADGTRAAKWWDEAIYDRIVRAVEAERTRIAITPAPTAMTESELLKGLEDKGYIPPQPSPYRPPPGTVEKILSGGRKLGERLFRQSPGRLEADGYRPPVNTASAILDDDDRPIFDRGSFHERKRADFSGSTSKAKLQEELREAVRRTAALPVPRDKNDG